MVKRIIVESPYGKIKGSKSLQIYKFLGIPYAVIQGKEDRFKKSKPIRSSEGIMDGTKPGPVFPQPATSIDLMIENLSQDEFNSLVLNIWTPSLETKSLPVMVWIHGGSFVTGHGTAINFSPFVNSGNVVVVSLNYRLGLLGFFDIPNLGSSQYTPNRGLLDIVEALKWVKQNIDYFGGNSENITIFGESAGATAVICLMTMPDAKNLFHKAISQSSSMRLVLSNDQSQVISNRVYAFLDDPIQNIDTFIDLPIERINKVNQHILSRDFERMGPVIDGKTLPKHPFISLQKGVAKDIPLLLGTNKDERKLWNMWNPDADKLTYEELQNDIGKMVKFHISDKNKLMKVNNHYSLSSKKPRDIFDAIFTDYYYWIPNIKIAEMHSQHQKHTYMYLFTWESPLEGGKYGAFHALDIPFVFGMLPQNEFGILPKRTEETEILSKAMMNSWSSFSYKSNPKNSLIPSLNNYDMKSRSTIIFDGKIEVQNDPLNKTREFWENLIQYPSK